MKIIKTNKYLSKKAQGYPPGVDQNDINNQFGGRGEAQKIKNVYGVIEPEVDFKQLNQEGYQLGSPIPLFPSNEKGTLSVEFKYNVDDYNEDSPGQSIVSSIQIHKLSELSPPNTRFRDIASNETFKFVLEHFDNLIRDRIKEDLTYYISADELF